MSPDALGLSVVSLSWREAPSRVRALLAGGVPPEVWAGLQLQGGTGLVEVHTCARSMWLVSGGTGAWLGALLHAHVQARCGVGPTVWTGTDALTFLYRVAVGLDSLAQGEADVGRQVRRAFAQARRVGHTDPLLHAAEHGLAHLAAAGQREAFVRPNRGLGQLAVAALVDAGADRRIPVGVIGAGAIGRRVAASLIRAGWAPPVLYNRTAGPGLVALDRVGGHEALVVCTAGPAGWFRPPADVRRVVDLGLPSQVDGPTIGLDRLLTGQQQALPEPVLARAEAAVAEEVLRVAERWRNVDLRRGLGGANVLRDRFVDECLEDALSEGLDGLAPEQRRRVMRAAEGAIRRYNHQLLTWVRAGFGEGS